MHLIKKLAWNERCTGVCILEIIRGADLSLACSVCVWRAKRAEVLKGSRLLPPPSHSPPNPHYQMYDVLSLQHNDAQFT